MNGKSVEDFIKSCFTFFYFDYKDFFYYDFDHVNFEDIVWLEEDGSIIIDAVRHASEVLGISVDDIMNKNADAFKKWLDRYPYFDCIGGYKYTYEKSFHTSSYDELRVLGAIFDIDLSDEYQSRFNYEDITQRMIKKLKMKNLVEPGTYHEGADIRNLMISTKNFCSYNKIDTMVNSFIEMINNAKTLFLKAIKTDLSEEELEEYNFLVTALGLRDRYYTKGYLYYSQLIKVRDFYKDLTLDNFYDDIIFKNATKFMPWRYIEFIENQELVQKYLDVIPAGKALMRKYAMDASRFKCVFTWSDAEHLVRSPEEEAMLSEFYQIIGEEDVPIEERPLIPTVVYIDKTDEELDGAENAAEKIMEYCSPVKLGGLKINMPSEYDSMVAVRRIMDFVGKVESSNYVERMVDRWNHRGGACNE